MANFIGTVKGSKGLASRVGGKKSGLKVAADGWLAGVEIYAHHDEETDRDEFHIYETGGSRGTKPKRLIAIVKERGAIELKI